MFNRFYRCVPWAR